MGTFLRRLQEIIQERVSDETSLLLPSEAASLRNIPIHHVYLALRTRVIRDFSTKFSLEQLRTPDVQANTIRPILSFVTERALKAGVYICLLNYWDFMRESEQQLGLADIYKTRALVCELLALDILQNYSSCTVSLVQVLTFQFSPDQGSFSEGCIREDMSDIYSENDSDKQFQKNLNTSALGIASRSGAKIFTASALVQATIQWIWSGEVVFYGMQIDSDAYYSEIERISTSPDSLIDLRLGIGLHTYLPNRFGGMFRASRLRVPMYQNCLNVFFYIILLALYSIVLSNRSERLTWPETVLFIFVLAFSVDEIRQLFSCGVEFYFQNVWNFLDIGIYGIFLAYFVIRFQFFFQGGSNEFAHDLLACNAVLLWPRLLFILDQYPFFGCLIITLKHMFMDATLFFTMAFVFFVGFYQAFCNLAPQKDPEFAPYNILMIMLRIFFGSSYLGFDVAFKFSPWFGPLVMFFYIAITALFLTTILISIFNQSFSIIATNASQEHLFIFTTKVMEFVESESLFPFIPPFNLIQFFFIYPLYPFLTSRNYAFTNRTAIRIVYAPFLAVIYFYERYWLGRSLSSRSLFMRNQFNLANRSIDTVMPILTDSSGNDAACAPTNPINGASCSCGKSYNKFSSSLASSSFGTMAGIIPRQPRDLDDSYEQNISTILARQNNLEAKLDQILSALNERR